MGCNSPITLWGVNKTNRLSGGNGSFLFLRFQLFVVLFVSRTFFWARSGSSSFTAVLSNCSSRPLMVMVKFSKDTFT